MFKKYSYIDILFFVLTGVFALLGIYEFIKFLIPHYSFLRATGVFVFVSLVYAGYKNNFSISRAQKSITSARNKNETIKNKLLFVKKHRDVIGYGSFIAMSMIIIFSMFLDL